MKKKSGCLKALALLAVTFVALIAMWCLTNFRSTVRDGHPLVQVSPETTCLDGPLDENGDVDYVEALNLELSDGVTLDNNAVIKFLEGLGPVMDGTPVDSEVFRRLAIERPSKTGVYWIEFSKWLNEQGIDYSSHVEEESFVESYPWAAEEFPVVERWYQRNQRPMEAIREGAKRPRYYYPLIPDPSASAAMLSLKFYSTQAMRNLARFFQISAMRHLGRDDASAALQELLAIYRLGNLVRQGKFLIDDLVGFAIIGIADSGVTTVCASGKATSQELKDFMRELDKIPPAGGLAESLGSAERYFMLDTIVTIGRGDTDTGQAISASRNNYMKGTLGQLGIKTIDWQECLTIVNHWYERASEVVKIVDPVKQEKELNVFNRELMQLRKAGRSSTNLVTTVLGTRRAKGKAVGEMMAYNLMPDLSLLLGVEQRRDTYMERVKVVLAVAGYKKDNGRFPENLEVLVPEYFPSVPKDCFSFSPIQYEVIKNDDAEDSVLIYSVGKNGVDEGGQNNQMNSGNAAGDDWGIDWSIKTWEQIQAERLGAEAAFDGNDFMEEDTQSDVSDGESDLPHSPKPSGKQE